MNNKPEKTIDGRLLVTYTIAALKKGHWDRVFIGYDFSKGKYSWVNQYRSAVVLRTESDAQLLMGNIKHREYPGLLKDKRDIDIASISILRTTVTFERIEDTNKYPWSNEDEIQIGDNQDANHKR